MTSAVPALIDDSAVRVLARLDRDGVVALADVRRPAVIGIDSPCRTASWTRWLGPRGTESRVAWTRRGIAALGLDGVPDRTNQDQRDAIAAAVTARAYSRGRTEAFGEIIVPVTHG